MLWYTCFLLIELRLSKTVVDAIWEQIDPQSFMERHSLVFVRIPIPGWTSRGETVRNGIVSLHFHNGWNNLKVQVCYSFNENNIPIYRSRVTGRLISRDQFAEQLRRLGSRVHIYDRLNRSMLERFWTNSDLPFAWCRGQNSEILAPSYPP